MAEPKQNSEDKGGLGHRVGPGWAENGLGRGIQAENTQHVVKRVNGDKNSTYLLNLF